MDFARISGITAAAAFGFAATTAAAQGGYGALSYFDWSVDHRAMGSVLTIQHLVSARKLRGSWWFVACELWSGFSRD